MVRNTEKLVTGDLDLKRRVENYLVGRKVPSLRRIRVDASNGTVKLRGRVGSYYEKQLCIHCCRRVAGVIQLVDEVDVEANDNANMSLC
jgi:osmotically-inducible protein OsmY